jgi:transglutaminase-like putative cysteine protease
MLAACSGQITQDPSDSATSAELRKQCGDGVCGHGESCSTCAADCGVCKISPDMASTQDLASPADLASMPDSASPPPPPPSSTFVQRSNPHSYHVAPSVAVTVSSGTPSKLSVMFGAPQTNAYQDVSNYSANTNGIIYPMATSGDSMVRFTQTSNLPSPGSPRTYSFTYDVTLYDVVVDLAAVTTIYPYDKSAATYTQNTGANAPYIDPANATISSIATTLAASAADPLSFARAAYDYTATHYTYIGGGLQPLANVLSAGGGDCGAFTIIFVSLLRHQGIPARPVVTTRPDGTTHVWAEFYLEGYDWVPVDATYKNGNPSGDFFGRVGISINGGGMVEDRELGTTLDIGGQMTQVAGLQTFAWYYWWSNTQVTASASFSQVVTPY